jgi:ribosome biogenesis GTPase A
MTYADQRLRTYARELRTIADELQLPNVAAAIDRELTARLDGGRLHVVVIGEVKHGKSSLINALVGHPVVPVAVTPTTGVLAYVRRGAPTGAYLVSGRRREAVSDEAFEAAVRGQHESETPDARPERVHAFAAVPDEVVLVDTPGLNDLDAIRSGRGADAIPRADAIIAVLDASQPMTRSEAESLRRAIDGVGGLEDSGATLAIVLNRADLVPPDERAPVVAHVQSALAKLGLPTTDVFTTDSKTALRAPTSEALEVREIHRLRRWIRDLAERRAEILPRRAWSALRRRTDLMTELCAIQRRAVGLDDEQIEAEIEAVESALASHDVDLEQLRVGVHERATSIASMSKTRLVEARERLEAQALTTIERASLDELTDVVPGAIEDAFLAAVQEEVSEVRQALTSLTQETIKTHGDLTQRRLLAATHHLGFMGPQIYVQPPSLAIEAGLVALGVAGTLVMYLAGMTTGMVMMVASPLATVALREASIRQARERARTSIPIALRLTFDRLEPAILDAVMDHVDRLDAHLSSASRALAEQLRETLQAAQGRKGRGEDDRSELESVGERIAGIRAALSALDVDADADPAPPPVVH